MRTIKKFNVLLYALIFLFVITSCDKTDDITPSNNEGDIKEANKDVVASKEHMGICYGPYHKTGQSPTTPIPTQQIKDDLSLIAAHFDFFRTYTVADNMEKVVEIAASKNLQVALGVHCYPDNQGGAAKTKADIDKAINATKVHKSTVLCIIIGNETSLNKGSNPNYVDPSVVAGYMDYAKTKLDGAGLDIPITSCLSAGGADVNSGEYAPQILEKCRDLNSEDHRIIMMNIYPFYGQLATNNITPADISGNMQWSFNNQGIKAAESKYGLSVVIGEIGWPTGGHNSFQNVTNAEINFNATLSWINGNNTYRQAYNTFWFEMFDEPWKTAEPYGAGTHWGLYQSTSQSPKFTIPNLL